MKTIKKCCYNCKNMGSKCNIYREISYFCKVSQKYKNIEDNETECCSNFSIKDFSNKFLLEEKNTKNIDINIIIDGVSVSSAEYDEIEWCKDCPSQCESDTLKDECLKALKLHLLEEAYKDAERDLK